MGNLCFKAMKQSEQEATLAQRPAVGNDFPQPETVFWDCAQPTLSMGDVFPYGPAII
ncbi:MAG: hypothetical protein V3571_10220 [Pseudodesulfovibrio sp.]